MIKARFLSAAAIAAVAPLLAVATPASADPVVTLPTTSTAVGQVLTINGSGCTNGTSAAYTGEFSTLKSDPTQTWQGELTANSDGTWIITTTIDSGAPLGDFNVNFYCATAPVTSMTDPAMSWVSGTYTYSLVAGAQMSHLRARSAATATPTTSGARLTIDPDALPVVDRVGIFGPRAAQLKQLVDYIAGPSAAASRGHLGNVKYVDTAIRLGAERYQNANGMKKYVALLDSGQTRVAVDEMIALTGHSAAYWNR